MHGFCLSAPVDSAAVSIGAPGSDIWGVHRSGAAGAHVKDLVLLSGAGTGHLSRSHRTRIMFASIRTAGAGRGSEGGGSGPGVLVQVGETT